MIQSVSEPLKVKKRKALMQAKKRLNSKSVKAFNSKGKKKNKGNNNCENFAIGFNLSVVFISLFSELNSKVKIG